MRSTVKTCGSVLTAFILHANRVMDHQGTAPWLSVLPDVDGCTTYAAAFLTYLAGKRAPGRTSLLRHLITFYIAVPGIVEVLKRCTCALPCARCAVAAIPRQNWLLAKCLARDIAIVSIDCGCYFVVMLFRCDRCD